MTKTKRSLMNTSDLVQLGYLFINNLLKRQCLRYLLQFQMIETDYDGEQIEKAFPGYKFITSLGRGAFGKVYLVSDRKTQEKLAVKKISCFGMCEYQRSNAVNEVRLLASLDHFNIIKFQSGMFDSNEDDLYLFMEYAAEGDLSQLIEQAKNKKKRVAEQTVWNVLLQIADALEYLHKNNIIHRDIKPANIFKTTSQIYKLGDLNVSKILPNGDFAKTKTGSPLYTCPEVWNKEEGYNQKCDIWSLGVVAYELCCLKVPYQANTIDELVRKQKTTKAKSIPSVYSSTLNDLILQMLHYLPQKRISAQRVKSVCMRALKMEQEDNLIPLDPLIQTIVIPESEERWINLVPLPPKAKKQHQSIIERKESKEKCHVDISSNRSNIFSTNANQNKSLLIPKSKNSYEKHVRVRLPSIQKKEALNNSQIRGSQKSREKSRQKSRENTRSSETPQKKEVFSSRILRKG